MKKILFILTVLLSIAAMSQRKEWDVNSIVYYEYTPSTGYMYSEVKLMEGTIRMTSEKTIEFRDAIFLSNGSAIDSVTINLIESKDDIYLSNPKTGERCVVYSFSGTIESDPNTVVLVGFLEYSSGNEAFFIEWKSGEDKFYGFSFRIIKVKKIGN